MDEFEINPPGDNQGASWNNRDQKERDPSLGQTQNEAEQNKNHPQDNSFGLNPGQQRAATGEHEKKTTIICIEPQQQISQRRQIKNTERNIDIADNNPARTGA